MRVRSAVAVLVCASFCDGITSTAQELTRTELGIESSTLFGSGFNSKTNSGLGGRVSFNLSQTLALEADGNYDVTRDGALSLQTGGRAVSAFFGPKAGIRTRRFGLFGKVRPGFVSFSDVLTSRSIQGDFSTTRKTHAAMDLGGVFELYPSRRLILRADIGEVLVRYGDSTQFGDASGFIVRSIGTIDTPLHLSIGASYRLGALHKESEGTSTPRRYQFGAEYSLITLQRVDFAVRDESGVGGWFTYELGRNFALDAGTNFFPRKVRFIGPQEGGRIRQTVAGLRWGLRRNNYGVFLKFRPGIQTYTVTEITHNVQDLVPGAHFPAFTDLVFDMGGIFEVYTSKHTMLRFDAGHAQIYYRERHMFDFSEQPFTAPGFSRPAIQLTGGFGLRF